MYEEEKSLFGCLVDNPSCTGKVAMACADDATATCVAEGKAVIGLSCVSVQTLRGGGPGTGPTMYGPYCVERPATSDAICALDSAPCDKEGVGRRVPGDATNTLCDTCRDGVWLERSYCY
jgi:hypothetical protein